MRYRLMSVNSHEGEVHHLTSALGQPLVLEPIGLPPETMRKHQLVWVPVLDRAVRRDQSLLYWDFPRLDEVLVPPVVATGLAPDAPQPPAYVEVRDILRRERLQVPVAMYRHATLLWVLPGPRKRFQRWVRVVPGTMWQALDGTCLKAEGRPNSLMWRHADDPWATMPQLPVVPRLVRRYTVAQLDHMLRTMRERSTTI